LRSLPTPAADFIVIEIDREAGQVAALAKELHEVVRRAIAGAFKPDNLEQGQSGRRHAHRAAARAP
jgi:hypothetical protein